MNILLNVTGFSVFVSGFLFISSLHLLSAHKKKMCKLIDQIDKHKKITEDYTHPLMFISLFFSMPFTELYIFRYIPKDPKYYTYPEFVKVIRSIKKINRFMLITCILMMVTMAGTILLIPKE